MSNIQISNVQRLTFNVQFTDTLTNRHPSNELFRPDYVLKDITQIFVQLKRLLFNTILFLVSFSGVSAQGYQDGLAIGEDAPLFSGLDQFEKEVSLEMILNESDYAVLIFYRGSWCGHCKRHLSVIQDSLQMLLDENASVVVVTPEQPESIDKMIGETGAIFSIVHDAGYSIMKEYEVDYVISEATVFKYLGPVTKRTAVANGNDEGVLPVPATYVIGKNGKIEWVHFDPVYSKRSSIYQILIVIRD